MMSIRTIMLFAILLLTVVLGEQRLRSHELSNAQIETKCRRVRGVPCGLITLDCCKPGTCISGFLKKYCDPANRLRYEL